MTTDAGRRAVTIPMTDWNRQVESSGIAEYGRLKAEQERDRYRVVLREIESWQKNPDWKHEPCACPTIAREALQQEQA